jgi:hypothetical protein
MLRGCIGQSLLLSHLPSWPLLVMDPLEGGTAAASPPLLRGLMRWDASSALVALPELSATPGVPRPRPKPPSSSDLQEQRASLLRLGFWLTSQTRVVLRGTDQDDQETGRSDGIGFCRATGAGC